MLTIAICDNDIFVRRYLTALVKSAKSDCIILEYDSGEQLLQAIAPCDILLLDIDLKGMNGVQVAMELRNRLPESYRTKTPIIIFVAEVEQYVFQAFDLGAFQYLLKPIDENKFKQVLLQAIAEYETGKKERLLFINTRTVHRVISQRDIYYIESNRRKVIINTETEAFEAYATMEDLQKVLGEMFFRCHRGYFVNMEWIDAYDRSTIHLQNGEEILMAKGNYNDFVREYMEFLRKSGIQFV